jgi:Holliday junction resolvasome RuvABC DNA-binding subunit
MQIERDGVLVDASEEDMARYKKRQIERQEREKQEAMYEQCCKNAYKKLMLLGFAEDEIQHAFKIQK